MLSRRHRIHSSTVRISPLVLAQNDIRKSPGTVSNAKQESQGPLLYTRRSLQSRRGQMNEANLARNAGLPPGCIGSWHRSRSVRMHDALAYVEPESTALPEEDYTSCNMRHGASRLPDLEDGT